MPQPQTEVRLTQVADRRSYETQVAGQKIETALSPSGGFGIQWRPKVGEGQVDRSLTVQSDAVLDVQEDGLRLVWQSTLEFRRSQRDAFRVSVPAEYLVEKVEGGNVRGWEIRKEASRQTVEITLLKTAKDSERFTLRLWRPVAVGEAGATAFEAPIVNVADAAMQGGQLTIRRSPLLDLRTVSAAGLSRADLSAAPDSAAPGGAGAEDSPLGIQPYEAYQFVSTPFSLRLTAAALTGHATAELETLFRISEYEQVLESRIKLDVRERPVHRVEIFLPSGLTLEEVTGPGELQWAVTQAGQRPLLTIYLAAGKQGELPIFLRGRLSSREETSASSDVGRIGNPSDQRLGNPSSHQADLVDGLPIRPTAQPKPSTAPVSLSGTQISLPVIEVRGVQRQEGDIAVQVDPVFEVEASGLVHCESILRDRVRAWLKPEQYAVTPLALHYRQADYGGTLRLALLPQIVSCDTTTNVRVTDRAVEETILLDFNVQQGGLHEIAFLLPAWMHDCRISVPLLRQKTVEPAGKQAGSPIRVQLEIQGDVRDKLRVLVQNDRLLTSQTHEAPIPKLQTCRANRQFVAMVSAGRDEVVVESASELELLGRQQKEWTALKEILPGNITQAYLVQPGAADPQLKFKTRSRSVKELPGSEDQPGGNGAGDRPQRRLPCGADLPDEQFDGAVSRNRVAGRGPPVDCLCGRTAGQAHGGPRGCRRDGGPRPALENGVRRTGLQGGAEVRRLWAGPGHAQPNELSVHSLPKHQRRKKPGPALRAANACLVRFWRDHAAGVQRRGHGGRQRGRRYQGNAAPAGRLPARGRIRPGTRRKQLETDRFGNPVVGRRGKSRRSSPGRIAPIYPVLSCKWSFR